MQYFSDVNNARLVSLFAVFVFFLGLCTIIFTIYTFVFMYLNALNKNNNHLKSTWFYLVQSLLFPADLRRILHMRHTDAMLNQKFNKMFVLVCSAVSLMKTAQRQIKSCWQNLFTWLKITSSYVCVNQSVTVALAGCWGRSITEEAFEDVLVVVKVRH